MLPFTLFKPGDLWHPADAGDELGDPFFLILPINRAFRAYNGMIHGFHPPPNNGKSNGKFKL